MRENRFIGYFRVSTERQSASGLGLEAQKHSVTEYLRQLGGKLLAEYVEVESGRRNDRPQLLEALKECKRQKATLLIAKLDRLGRNLHFVSGLLEAGVEFKAVDNPHAGKMMIQLLAVFAEFERDAISKRTKEALSAAKARGVKLGSRDQAALSIAGSQAIASKAREFAKQIQPTLSQLQAEGITTVSAVAAALNRRGIMPMRGDKWYPITVARLQERLSMKITSVVG